MNVRELVTKFIFQADTAKVKQFSEAIEQAKVVAVQAGQGLGAMGKIAQESANRIRTAMEGVPRELRAIDEQAKLFGKSFDAAKAKVETLQRAIRSLTMEGMGASNPHLQGLNAELQSLQGSIASRRGGGHGGGGLSGWMGGIGHHLAMMGAGYVGFQAGEAGLEHFSEFQQNIQKAAAAMAAGSSDMGKLNEAIVEMRKKALSTAADLGFSPRQVSEAMMEIGSKGFEAKDVQAIAPTALQLARAGMADPKTATELLTSSIEGFYGRDKGAGKHREVGDLLVAAHDAGGVSLSSLLESNKYDAPVAGAMGQSMKDVMTLTALLGRFGMHGSIAGNGLKSIMSHMAAPNTSNAKKLETMGLEGLYQPGKVGKHGKAGKGHMGGQSVLAALGINPSDAKHNMRSIVDIMHDVVLKTAKMGTTQRAAVFKGLFGLENLPQGMAIARAMAEDNGKAFLDVAHRMDNSTGALDRMAKVMNEGLAPAWQRVLAKGEVLADLLIEKMAPGMVDVLDAVSWLIDRGIDLVTWFDEVTDNGKKLHELAIALRIALLALADFAVVAGVKALAEAITSGLIPSIFNATKASWAFLAANFEWALIVAALALLVLAIQDVIAYFNGADSITGKVIERMKSGFQTLAGEIDEAKDSVVAFVAELASLVDAVPGLQGVAAAMRGLHPPEGPGGNPFGGVQAPGALDAGQNPTSGDRDLSHLQPSRWGTAIQHAGGALAGVTPAGDVARGGSRWGSVSQNVTTTVHVHQTSGSPNETGRAVEHHVRQAAASAARQTPRQAR